MTMKRAYLMCPPTYFDVRYAINPWMRPDVPVDRRRALFEWERLRSAHESLGHRVHVLEPEPGLPDMVFAANGATVVGGAVLCARFRYAQRSAEAAAHRRWFAAHGYRRIIEPTHVNEGEGDHVFAHRAIVAGYGFRSAPGAGVELGAAFGLPVVGVRLVDPRFYHLDTALCVLDPWTAAYFPGAFEHEGVVELKALFPELIEASEDDAVAFGLNAVSDGRHVIISRDARVLGDRLAERGYHTIPIDLTEFRKAGGGPKCCTLELRP